MLTDEVIKFRGVINIEEVLPYIRKRNYNFINEQKLGYYLSYENGKTAFHVVDRFASLPLFYIIKNGKPIVSEDIDQLINELPQTQFDPLGYFCAGGFEKGSRMKADRTPFQEIRRIPPGHYLEYKDGEQILHEYWSFKSHCKKPFNGSYEEACEKLKFLLKQAVNRCYDFAPNASLHLSGGLDSGTIAALWCQHSKNKVKAYSLQLGDAPKSGNKYESQFLAKYQKHYPQVVIKKYSTSLNKYVSIHPPKLLEGAGNWYMADEECEEFIPLNEMSKNGQKFIITGLGGDELASYGTSFQNEKYAINNGAQLRLYMKWKFFLRKYIKERFRSFFDKKRLNQVHSLIAERKIFEYSFEGKWFTKEFQRNISDCLTIPFMTPWLVPLSYNFRLDFLDSCYFTYRSDYWNYVGKPFGVTYLHPLLDADLVDFCASLPQKFYRNRKPREMIKTAMKGIIPDELLMGTKRRVFLPDQKIKKEDVLHMIESIIPKQDLYKSTFAARIYDFNFYDELLLKTKKKLKKFSNKDQEYLLHSRILVNTIARIHQKGDYLNKYFS